MLTICNKLEDLCNVFLRNRQETYSKGGFNMKHIVKFFESVRRWIIWRVIYIAFEISCIKYLILYDLGKISKEAFNMYEKNMIFRLCHRSIKYGALTNEKATAMWHYFMDEFNTY